MSEIFEKRPDGANRRQTRADKERKDKRKVRVLTISVVAVLAILFTGAMLINSRVLCRIFPALTIGGIDFPAAEYDYYFASAYNEFRNQYISYLGEETAQQYLPSTSESLASQTKEEGVTWEDYFAQSAKANMSNIAKLYTAANTAGFVLSDEAIESIDSQIDTLKSQAGTYSYPSVNSFIQAMYGYSVNEAFLRKILERASIAYEYNKSVYDSYTYTPQQLTQYYSENADTLDNFNFRSFTVLSAPSEETYDTEEEKAAADEVALNAAREQAKLIVSGISSEDDYINSAKEYDEVSYEKPESTLMENAGSNLDYAEYGEWLRDSARKYGDVTTIDTSNGAYVIFFLNRDKNEYSTANMRWILMLPESVDSSAFEEGEDDPEYTAAVEDAKVKLEEKAEAALAEFTGGGATEEKLLEMMKEYSSDNKEGGLYEKIQKGSMGVTELDDWLFAPERKYGDYSLIKSESYGYHLVFFMGNGERSCDVSAESGLREKDHQAWTDGLATAEPVIRWAFSLTQKH